MLAAIGLTGIGSLAVACAASAQLPAPPPSASSQSSPGRTARDDAAAGDIVVTARRRNENLQDVPISVTAISGQALATRNIRDAVDLQYQTPSLSITTNGASRDSLAFSIRGQRTQETQLLTDPPVGTYFAEVVQPRTYGFGTAFYDIQNVQVLKGVQGTLFGRNMTGGAVLIEPNHPDLKAFHAEGAAQYGNYNLVDVTGMVNIPVISDVLGIRVSGKYRDRDGFTKDVSTDRDYDDQHYKTIRASAELHLGRFTSYLEGDYLRLNVHGTALKIYETNLVDPRNGNPTVVAQQIGASPFFPVAAGVPPQDLPAIFARDLALGRYRVDYGGIGTADDALSGGTGEPYSRIRNWGVTNKTTFTAGPVTFKNIFGYRQIRYVNHSDYDGSAAAFIYPIQFSNTNNTSEEFQMQGKPFGSRLDLTIGGYYFREAGRDGAYTLQFPQLASIGFASGIPALASYFLTQPSQAFIQSQVGRGVARSYAFYAAGTYAISDVFKFSGGIRYNNDLRRATVSPFYPNLTIPGLGTGICVYGGVGASPLAQCARSRTLKNEAATYDATLQYEPSADLTTYAAFRRGYRSGGFNLRAQDDATFQPFQPEKVKEVEVGVKKAFDFGGGVRLTTNLAAYYQDYTNVQRQNPVLIGGQVATIVTNIAAQHDYGGEFEANLRLPGGLSANLFYSYVKNKVARGDNGSDVMFGIPHHQLGGGVTYARTVDGLGELAANVSATYRSTIPFDQYDASGDQKGYALVNGRIGVNRIAGTAFGAAVFATNLTNKYYRQGGIALTSAGPVLNGVSPGGGVGYAASTYGEPRMYGVEVSVKF